MTRIFTQCLFLGFWHKKYHVAQVLGYLKSARLEHGLLINFGSYKFEMRKFAWSQNGTCRKSKPTFLLSAVSAFFAFFAV